MLTVNAHKIHTTALTIMYLGRIVNNSFCIRIYVYVDGPVIDNGTDTAFTVEEGMNFTFSVGVTANPPPDTSVLTRDGVTIANTASDPSSIELINVSRSQSGYYTLSISNDISTVEFDFRLTVKCKHNVIIKIYVCVNLLPFLQTLRFLLTLSQIFAFLLALMERTIVQKCLLWQGLQCQL